MKRISFCSEKRKRLNCNIKWKVGKCGEIERFSFEIYRIQQFCLFEYFGHVNVNQKH